MFSQVMLGVNDLEVSHEKRTKDTDNFVTV
jgi:hypothetical protein